MFRFFVWEKRNEIVRTPHSLKERESRCPYFSPPLMVGLRFFFCFRLLIFWGNFVECMILFLARVILRGGGWTEEQQQLQEI